MSQSEEVREEVLRGVVERVTFYDTENNFAVIQLSVDQQPNPITVTGPCLKPKPGAHLAVRGRYVTHPKFGVQFAARWTEEIEPSSEEGLKKYLSGFIQGIGAKTAHKLVTAFGAKTLEIIFQNPDLLTTVPGLGKRKAEMIRQALLERRERIEIDRFLAEHNISRGLTNRLYERYGARAIEVLKEDPYILAYEMHGVGFATADAIALSLGVNPDAPQRLKAGLYYALERSADDGHSFLEGASLAARARHLLGL
ncbi:MAG: ATP-dependent RecD-like DNA helicase, partial [Deltaproteobacteria bacterium]|nr:ATP-dependent RecD-like DNA helicase [Deltaproteobacteria bacterium]